MEKFVLNFFQQNLTFNRAFFWVDVLNEEIKDLIFTTPETTLLDCIRSLIHNRIHRLPVVDPNSGNILFIVTHKRILRFLFLYVRFKKKFYFIYKTQKCKCFLK